MTGGRRLGRGLESLLGPVNREQAVAEGALRDLPVAQVRPNPFQPRTHFDEAALAELVASIEASGLLQPIVVRSRNGVYEIIAGERRWRAVQKLGWPTVPAVVKEADDQTLLTLALIENLQRHDLSPIDEAQGYQRLIEQFRLPQAEVARMVGRNRSTVANLLRLLKLPAPVRAMVHDGRLSEGHARALLGLEAAEAIVALAEEAVREGMSVRDVEARVRGDAPTTASGNAAPMRAKERPRTLQVAADVRRVEDALRNRLGTDVRVTQKRKGRGVVAVSYYSNDDLARLLELILGEPFEG
ncbi:MAG TPA: ParB/RepB/Spo0J family partition protein [Gemmatimonadales bacterium]|nr:ParB/RepB/Spo0J family partition protein [Gemmatimonadales bacterium]